MARYNVTQLRLLLVIDKWRNFILNHWKKKVFRLVSLPLIKAFVNLLNIKFGGLVCYAFVVYDILIDMFLLYFML